MSTPKVSVIIPVYNTEKYLRICLDSVINQTLQDIEIICINDGSTDGSLNILNEYALKDNRIKIIDKKNEGVSVARNAGIENAKGEYIMFVDADDWLNINATEILYSEIIGTDYDILNFGFYECFDKDMRHHYVNNLIKREFEKCSIENQLALNTNCWNKLYKTTFLKYDKLLRFPENVKTSEDGVFCILTYLHNAKFKNINKILYYYRKNNPSSVTNSCKMAIQNDLQGLKYLHNLQIFQSLASELKYAILDKWLGYAVWYKCANRNINYNKQIKTTLKYLHTLYSKKELKKLPNYKKLTNNKWKEFLRWAFRIGNNPTKTHKIITFLGLQIKFWKKLQINTGKCDYLKKSKVLSPNSETIHIVFGIDDNYIQQCAVTMSSILLNTKAESNLHFYLMNTGLSEKSINNLETLKNIRPFKIEYLDVSHCDFSKFPLNRDWISVATYYRLFLSEVMPSNVDKCIYMDCDMIAEDDLSILWNYDISNYLAGVVEDEASRTNIINLNLPLENNYFNAGMIVFNLRKMREFNVVERAAEYFKNNQEKIKLQDQDILNGTLNGKCLFLPLRWNINTPAYMREENNHFYTKKEEEIAIYNPGIIHFTGEYKPWFTYSCHPLRGEYQKYLQFTNFKKDVKDYNIKEFWAKIYCKKKNWNIKETYFFGLNFNFVKYKGYSFFELIFSIKNSENKKHKVLTISGIKFKFKSKKKSKKKYEHMILLGENCELAFQYVNILGVPETSLFNWCFVFNKENLLNAINNPLIVTKNDVQYKDYAMIDDPTSGCRFHCTNQWSYLQDKNGKPDILKYKNEEKILREKNIYLANKLINIYKSSKLKLFIYKAQQLTSKNQDSYVSFLTNLNNILSTVTTNFNILFIVTKEHYNVFDKLFSKNNNIYIRMVNNFTEIGDAVNENISDNKNWTKIFNEFQPSKKLQHNKKYKYENSNKDLTILQKIFSVKNKDIRKIITILGVKFKIKSKKLIEQKRWFDLNEKLHKQSEQYKRLTNSLVNKLDQQTQRYNEVTVNLNNKLDEQTQRYNEVTVDLTCKLNQQTQDYKIQTELFNKFKKIANNYLETRILNIDNTVSNKLITKEFLNFIEIEVSSFCNRQCWFCPNSKIDRHSQNILMPEETYLNILQQLKEINYDGLITYSRYNEPMADKELILKRISQAREYLPNVFLYTHSNGDYLDHQYIMDLADAGLELLDIQCYLDEHEEFDIKNVIEPKMNKIIERLGFDVDIETINNSFYSVKLKLQEQYKSLNAYIRARDFKTTGANRGESIDTIQGIDRKRPCFSPFYRMYIDYDGSVMPCCQVRHDIPSHSHMILGNINTESLFNIFCGEKFVAMRKNLLNWGPKISPCRSCSATICDAVWDFYDTDNFPELRNRK